MKGRMRERGRECACVSVCMREKEGERKRVIVMEAKRSSKIFYQ